MPVTPVKNLIYRAGLTALRPFSNRCLTIQGTASPDLKKILRRRQAHRATVLLSRPDQPVLEVRTGDPNPPPRGAYYHAASIAKMVTAVGALLMVQDGRLSLTDPIASYSAIPVPTGITLEHLLSHTSGIVDGPAYAGALSRQLPLDELLHADGSLSAHCPGEHFQYSNLGFGIVGSLMEEVSGSSLDRFMKDRVFRPHDIPAVYDLASLNTGDRLVSSRRLFPPASGFSLDGENRRKTALPLLNAEPLHHYGLAAGGLFMTADGLLELMKQLFVDRSLLSPLLFEAMITPRHTQVCHGYQCGFGLGMFCLESASGVKLFGHQGFAYGAVQGAFWSPASDHLLVSLNGGADESRRGRLGSINLDLINAALGGGQWTL